MSGTDEERSSTPALGEVGHFIPLPSPIPSDPYDEDGYCEWCGNGRWKYHRPECLWADAADASGQTP